MSNSETIIAELWHQSRLHISDEFELPPEIIRIENSTIASLGNFSASTGKAKSKKTFNVCGIVASALINGRILKYNTTLPQNKRKVLYIDTEQSSFHCKKVLKRIYQLADNSFDNDLLEFIMLRRHTPNIRLLIIEKAIYNTDNLGLVIIDGVRDLAYDINSPSESTALITKLMQWTDERQIHIHTVLHLNKSDDNTRGHLGTELNNKAETILQIKKDEADSNISIVSSICIRDKEFEPFAFFINENQLPELKEDYQPKQSKIQRTIDFREIPIEKHKEALQKTFSKNQQLGYDDLINELKESYSAIGFNYGTNKIKELKVILCNNKMILCENKTYQYNPDYNYTV